MASKLFDKIFKDKLKNLSVKFNPSDWIIMERLLEWQGLSQSNAEIDEVSFDEITMDKLQNIDPKEMIPDWDRMADLLQKMELEGEPSIEASEFDQAINNKLKDFKKPVDEAAWVQMTPILDRDRMAPVEELDNITKAKLNQIPEIDPAWSKMSTKINRELFLPESVVKYKLLEVVLVLLFTLSVYQLPHVDSYDDIIVTSEKNRADDVKNGLASTETESIVEQIPDKSFETTSFEKELVTLSKIDSQESVTDVPNKSLVTESEILTSDIVELSEEASPTKTLSELSPSVSDFLNAINAENLFSIKHSIFQSVVDDMPLFWNYAERIKNAYFLSGEVILTDIFGNEIVDQSRPVYTAEEIDEAPMDQLEAVRKKARITCLTCNSKDQKVGLALGLFTGSDYNQIITPFDPVYALDGTSQWNFSYGGGLSLSMQFKSWELEMGAIYTSNQYQPREVFEIYSGSISSGYIASTLEDIELDIVKVPLNFRFNLNLKDKWKIYALSGATMNMVIQSSYITNDIFIGSNSFATPSAPVQNADLTLKDFSGGILEGGRFSDNSYLTANLGLGVERALNNKWSLFAQPTYQRQIFSNGIGPNQDKYNSLSLFFGTRLSIK